MKIIVLLIGIFLNSMLSLSPKKENILKTLRKVNNYFMSNYPDPTLPTFVIRERSSNLWTRAVYYEGLMELQKNRSKSSIFRLFFNMGRFSPMDPP